MPDYYILVMHKSSPKIISRLVERVAGKKQAEHRATELQAELGTDYIVVFEPYHTARSYKDFPWGKEDR